MPYKISWRIPKRVLYMTLEGVITLEDIRDLDTELWQYLEQGDVSVAIVTDMTKVARFPTHILELKSMATHLKHPHLGRCAAVGNSSFVNSFAPLLGRIAGIELRMFRTTSKALEYVAGNDPALQELIRTK